MALNIPQLLASFTHKDRDTQRQYENTGKALNPVLGFVNKSFAILANGALRILPDVQVGNFLATLNAQVNGSSTVNGKFFANAGQAITGASTIQGTQVIQKNADGSAGGQLVQGNQTVNGALSTAAGIKTFGPINTYSGAPAAGGFYNCASGVTGAGNYAIPFAGSLVGVVINFNSAAVTTTYRFYTTGAWGDSFVSYNNTGAVSGGQLSATYAKGTYPFTAGQGFICKAYSSANSSSLACNIIPIFEMTA